MAIDLPTCTQPASTHGKALTLATNRQFARPMPSYLVIAIMLLASVVAHAQSVFESDNRPGGIAIVDLGPASKPLPYVQWNDRPVAVIAENDRSLAVVGIPLSVEPGEQTLLVVDNAGEQTSTAFAVNAHIYAEQRLTITNKRKVNPEPLDMVRITAENKRLKVVKSTRAERLMTDTFIWPVAGPVSSPFGLRRFFNGQPRRPHGGIDIAAPEGTPIMAAADGLILEADDYFFNGNSVFIEHGLGLQTFYAHLSRIDVASGERVSQGQIIGTVGETGRVTGPHLHWSVGLNGTWVDPLLVIDTNQPPELPSTNSGN
ncbi:MAG: peptidoglycan DD-metalloendopeptidase family protein [Granulosicoccus sp.]